jgi:hypothetical protein
LEEWEEMMILKIYRKLNEDNQDHTVTALADLLEKQGNRLSELVGQAV